MKRKLMIVLAVVLAFAVTVPAAYAALSDTQKQEVAALEKQILELRKQVIQKYVDAGDITAEQGKAMQDRMEQMYQYREANGFAMGPGVGRGPGTGRGMGPGQGMGSGFGPGQGRGPGAGTGICPFGNNAATAPAAQ